MKYTVIKQHFNHEKNPEYTKIIPAQPTKIYHYKQNKTSNTWYILGLNLHYFSIRECKFRPRIYKVLFGIFFVYLGIFW
jgi:hypothetical protein